MHLHVSSSPQPLNNLHSQSPCSHHQGHDFLVLGHAAGTTAPRPFNPAADTASLKVNNPVRRDSTMLPGFGWLVVAFKTDNRMFFLACILPLLIPTICSQR